jgi:hypothetical protein
LSNTGEQTTPRSLFACRSEKLSARAAVPPQRLEIARILLRAAKQARALSFSLRHANSDRGVVCSPVFDN